MEQEMMGWQWHQLNHMQMICTSLQTDNHASTFWKGTLNSNQPMRVPHHSVFTGRMPFLPPNQ